MGKTMLSYLFDGIPPVVGFALFAPWCVLAVKLLFEHELLDFLAFKEIIPLKRMMLVDSTIHTVKALACLFFAKDLIAFIYWEDLSSDAYLIGLIQTMGALALVQAGLTCTNTNNRSFTTSLALSHIMHSLGFLYFTYVEGALTSHKDRFVVGGFSKNFRMAAAAWHGILGLVYYAKRGEA